MFSRKKNSLVYGGHTSRIRLFDDFWWAGTKKTHICKSRSGEDNFSQNLRCRQAAHNEFPAYVTRHGQLRMRNMTKQTNSCSPSFSFLDLVYVLKPLINAISFLSRETSRHLSGPQTQTKQDVNIFKRYEPVSAFWRASFDAKGQPDKLRPKKQRYWAIKTIIHDDRLFKIKQQQFLPCSKLGEWSMGECKVSTSKDILPPFPVVI